MCKESEKLTISEIKAMQELIAGTNNLAELKISLATTLAHHWPTRLSC